MATAALLSGPAHATGRQHLHAALAAPRHGLVKTAVHPAGAVAKPSGVRISWTSAAALPTAVAELGGGTGVGGKFYVIGGYNSSGVVVNNNQLYNKSTNTWTAKAVIPGAGGGWADASFCYNAADKTIHVVDGTDGSFIYAAHQVYNPITNVWSFLAAPNTPATGNFYSQDSGCAFIGGMMYLFGGYGLTDTNPSAAIQNITWVYDPATDTWSDTGMLMKHPRLWMGYTSNTTNAFAAGGTDNISTFAPISSTEKFTPATGWAAKASLPKALLAPGEGLVQTHLLVWGGGDSTFTTQKTTYHCVLPSCSSFSTTAFNLPSAKWFSAFGSGTSVFNGGGDTGSGVPVNTAEHLP